METKFRLKPSELGEDFIRAIQESYGENRVLEISIRPVSSPQNADEETREEHLMRLKEAAKLANQDTNLPLTADQFLSLRNKLQGL